MQWPSNPGGQPASNATIKLDLVQIAAVRKEQSPAPADNTPAVISTQAHTPPLTKPAELPNPALEPRPQAALVPTLKQDSSAKAETTSPTNSDPPTQLTPANPSAPGQNQPPPNNSVQSPPTAPQTLVSNTGQSNPETSWHARLLAHLEQHKRYPAIARQRRQQGKVQIRFTMDRQGNVLASEVIATAGFILLDRAALAMLNHAQPLPPPPTEISGQILEMDLPVQFSLQ